MAHHHGIGKLKLKTAPLVGREKELEVLRTAYRRTQDDGSSECVIIEGASGSGKSALLQEVFGNVCNGNNNSSPLLCRGKFNTIKSTEPFLALKQAFSDLVRGVLEADSPAKEDMCASVREVAAEGNEQVLSDLVPDLSLLLLHGHHEEEKKEEEDTLARPESQKALNRLKYLANELLKAVCGKGPSVVFLLDDLQWADDSTLVLLESILSSSELDGFLFVGTHRPVDQDHPLRATCRKLEHHVPVHLDALSVTDVDRIVQHCTKLDATATQPLSEIVHRKTQGNALFVLEYLQMLQRRALLEFSTISFRWTFDIKIVETKTSLSDSIAEVVGGRIRDLPCRVQTILKLCACLWSQFNVDQLAQIVLNEHNLEDLTDAATEEQNLVELLDVAVDNGFLDRLADREYKFSHDKIQESAYMLFEDLQARNRMHLRLGRIMLSNHKGQKENGYGSSSRWMLFACVDQLNKGSEYIDDEAEQLELTHLNLKAGQAAKAQSAFVPAKNYLKAGIDLLPRECCWDKHYQLTLDLFLNFTEVSTCLGNYSESDQYAEEVLRYSRTKADRLPVYRTKIDAYAQQSQFKDAISTAQTALRELGQPMPKKANMLQVLYELLKTKQMLKGKSDQDILNLPLVQDQSKVAAMEILNYYAAHCLSLERTPDMLLCMLRNVQLTIKHGLSKLSPSSICQYGIVIGSMGSIEEAYRLGSIALRLLDKLDAGEYEAYCLQVVHAFEIHWRKSFYACLDPLQQAYQKGMLAGDTELAFYGAATYIMYYVWSGLYLGSAEKDCRRYCEQMLQYGREDNYAVGCTVWQFLLNLVGIDCVNNPTQFTGMAMDEEAFVKKHSMSKNLGALQSFWLFKAQLCYYFRKYDEAARLLKSFGDTIASLAINHYIVQYAYFNGLNLLALARQTKKLRFVFAAKKAIKQLETWAKDKNPNVPHKLLLLNAEYKALKEKDTYRVRELYDKAIAMASRGGLLQDAALANERAAIALESLGDKFWASHYTKQARALYEDWGATAKVGHLVKIYGSEKLGLTASETCFWESSQMSSTNSAANTGSSLSLHAATAAPRRRSSMGYKGVPRFDASASEQHSTLSYNHSTVM